MPVDTRQKRVGSCQAALDRRADRWGEGVVVFATSFAIADIASNVRIRRLSVGEHDTLHAADKKYQLGKVNAERGHRRRQYLDGLCDFDKSTS